MPLPDTLAHVRAESPFVDDLPEPAGLLHGAVLASSVARGEIVRLDTAPALAMPGVAGVFTAADIPGENQIGNILQDEPLLAEGEVHHVGQPVALVVAGTPEQARAARNAIVLEIEEKEAIFDPRSAAERGDLIAPARSISCGSVDEAWARCSIIVEGRADSGGQEHLYLETQACLAVPEARGRLHLFPGTQSPSGVQRITARVLGLPMHDIEVEVQRLGGAFGGKEDQATPWAALAALAAVKLARPVKVVLRRGEDMRMTGKRHPYSTDFRLGLDETGRFLAFEATYYQSSGAAADLSTAIMQRTLFHATNSYFIPHVRVTGLCCRTNLPPFTAFRGFGGPQAMFVMESAIAAAAEKLGRPAWELQEINLLREDNQLPYGMRVRRSNAVRSFRQAKERFGLERRAAEIERFNASSPLLKRGLAVMPICFGISFTNASLNQAGALVHIYTDGSVSVSTAAVEMGQGVTTKIRRITATALGISESRIRLESTSTSRVANMSPTAASTATDLNGMAALMACRMLTGRLKAVAAELLSAAADDLQLHEERVLLSGEETGLDWNTLVAATWRRRVDLSAHALYATPNLHYDPDEGKGKPFAYHVFGTAIIEARVDTLRGTASIESVQVVHDAGRSLDLLVDRGQAEGAIVQGIGWMTLEELVYSEDGHLLSDSLATYKIPDLHFAPRQMEVIFLEDADNPEAVMHTKGIGEPPFMYGIGAFFAIRNAIRAARPLPARLFFAPLTNERILAMLEGEA